MGLSLTCPWAKSPSSSQGWQGDGERGDVGEGAQELGKQPGHGGGADTPKLPKGDLNHWQPWQLWKT